MTTKTLLALSLTLFLNTFVFCQTNLISKNNTNIIYGKNYVFAIETPKNWVNDTILAKNFRLKCFFYPSTDSSSQLNSYIYPLGINKLTSNESLSDFLKKDTTSFRLKHPDFTLQITQLINKPGIIKTLHYSYSNLEERFKEDVVYNETDSCYIIITFSAINQLEYNKYAPVFDSLISSFEYLGKNPTVFFNEKK